MPIAACVPLTIKSCVAGFFSFDPPILIVSSCPYVLSTTFQIKSSTLNYLLFSGQST